MISGVGAETDTKQVTAAINTMEAAVNQYFAENQKYPSSLTAIDFKKFLPDNAKVTALKSRMSYKVNANNSFCLSYMVGSKTITSPSSSCTATPVTPEPKPDLFAPPAARAVLGSVETSDIKLTTTSADQFFGADGKLYRFSYDPAAPIEVVDVTTGEKTYIPKPTLSSSETSFSLVDNEIIVTQLTGKPQIYNMNTKTWRAGTAPPTGNLIGQEIVLNGEIYIIGSNGSNVGNGFYKYNPKTDKWTKLSPWPFSQEAYTANSYLPPAYSNGTVVKTATSSFQGMHLMTYNGRIYMMGGNGSANGKTFTVPNLYSFNPATSQWSLAASGGFADSTSSGVSATAVGNKIYKVVDKKLFVHDIPSGSWTALPQTLTAPSNYGNKIIYYNNELLFVPESGNIQKINFE